MEPRFYHQSLGVHQSRSRFVPFTFFWPLLNSSRALLRPPDALDGLTVEDAGPGCLGHYIPPPVVSWASRVSEGALARGFLHTAPFAPLHLYSTLLHLVLICARGYKTLGMCERMSRLDD